jgi:hypothetical protein
MKDWKSTFLSRSVNVTRRTVTSIFAARPVFELGERAAVADNTVPSAPRQHGLAVDDVSESVRLNSRTTASSYLFHANVGLWLTKPGNGDGAHILRQREFACPAVVAATHAGQTHRSTAPRPAFH